MAQTTNTRPKYGMQSTSKFMRTLNNEQLAKFSTSGPYAGLARKEIARRSKRQKKID